LRYVKLPLPQFYNELNSSFNIYNIYIENGFTYSSEQNLCSVKTCCSVQFWFFCVLCVCVGGGFLSLSLSLRGWKITLLQSKRETGTFQQTHLKYQASLNLMKSKYHLCTLESCPYVLLLLGFKLF